MKNQTIILIFIITVLFLNACIDKKTVIKGKEKSCQDYYLFLEKNWLKKDDIYYFEGNPKYWKEENYETYVKDNCLLSLSKTQIKSIFGEPTIEFKHPKIDLFIYCMDKNCYNSKKVSVGGNSLQITFDEEGKVNSILINPYRNNVPN